MRSGENHIAVRAAYMDSGVCMIRLSFLFFVPIIAVIGFAGCFHVRVSMDPVEVHATVDVNVKVDQALNNFFGDLDAKSKTLDASEIPAAPAQ